MPREEVHLVVCGKVVGTGYHLLLYLGEYVPPAVHPPHIALIDCFQLQVLSYAALPSGLHCSAPPAHWPMG